MTDSLLAFRGEFPILDRTTYLVSHSLGAMPRTVPDRLAEYVDTWAELGVRAWANGWWEMPISVELAAVGALGLVDPGRLGSRRMTLPELVARHTHQ